MLARIAKCSTKIYLFERHIAAVVPRQQHLPLQVQHQDRADGHAGPRGASPPVLLTPLLLPRLRGAKPCAAHNGVAISNARHACASAKRHSSQRYTKARSVTMQLSINAAHVSRL